MREIKFRGKQKYNNDWIVGCLDVNKDKTYFIKQDILSWLSVIPETVGQFTDEL